MRALVFVLGFYLCCLHQTIVSIIFSLQEVLKAINDEIKRLFLGFVTEKIF